MEFLSESRTSQNGVGLRHATLTISLAARRGSALSNLALVLQVEVPALLFTFGVLQVEGDDSLGLVDSILALASIALERLLDDVERGRGGVGICGEY